MATKWTFTQYKTFNEIVQIPHAGNKKMRLFSESPLIQSLTKERKVSPLCYCVQMTWSLLCWVPPPPPPPPSNYSHQKKKKKTLLWLQCSDVFWKLRFKFKSSYNVNGHHIPKAKISLILQHFLFDPSPNLRHLHTPHSRNHIKYITVW